MKDLGTLFERALSVICAVILGIMLVVVFAQVVTRYVLQTPFTWGDELARFLQIWLTFLGASLAFLVGGHASIQMLIDRLPEKANRITRVFIALLMGGFFLILGMKGIHLARFTWSDESPALSIPYGIVYLALPVASGFIFLTQTRDLWRLFHQPDRERVNKSG